MHELAQNNERILIEHKVQKWSSLNSEQLLHICSIRIRCYFRDIKQFSRLNCDLPKRQNQIKVFKKDQRLNTVISSSFVS